MAPGRPASHGSTDGLLSRGRLTAQHSTGKIFTMKTKQISAGSCGALLVCWLVICTACTGDLVSPDPAEDQGGALDGVPPKLDQAPPKLDHGAPPKLDHGAPPKLDKGPPPKLDQGTPPKLDQGTPPGVVPPLGGSSKGKGGGPSPSGKNVVHNGVSYILQVPSSYSSASPMPLMIVFSGTEGASVMAQNMSSVAPYLGLPPMIVAVLDGKATFGNGQTGAVVLDHVRSLYNVSNDRTYLLSESAGTSAGLQLGFQLRRRPHVLR